MNTTHLKSESVATIRTSWYLAFVAIVTYLVNRFAIDIDLEDPVVQMVLVAIAGFVYRVALLIQKNYPGIAILFFGLATPPSYKPPVPPIENAAVAPPERDRGYTPIELLVYVIIAIILIVVLFKVLEKL